MGEQGVTAYQDAEQLRFFMKCLLKDLDALEQLLERGLIETGRSRVGAEQEVFLVDAAHRPAPIALELLKDLDDPHYTNELALFNLEFNLDPFEFHGDCLSRLENQTQSLLDRARAAATRHGAAVLLTGILPTLRQEDMSLANMTPVPRYRALNEALLRLRGGKFRLRLKGIDELIFEHDSLMLEACNTSFQVHLQVSPEDFPRFYNTAQLLAAPITAASANSPLLFGKRLWRETRLALFQQSVDTRKGDLPLRDIQPRVSFGTEWVRESVIEIYREDVARFRALIGSAEYEDPFAAIEAGRAPRLDALRLHCGTVYRWNRACYGISNGLPHLRIENRLLPAGPSVLDEVANAAFWFGMVKGAATEYGDPRFLFSFDEAKANLLAAARLGLSAQFTWLDGRSIPASELILGTLLPLARNGLRDCGILTSDIDRFLGVVQARVESGRTGACWQLTSLAKMDQACSPEARSSALVQASLANQERGIPVHEWEFATLSRSGTPRREDYARVGSFMTSDIFTVHEDELVDLAANLMDWRHIRHVPVEDAGHHLVGLVTHRSLMRFFSRRREGSTGQAAVKAIMTVDPITVREDTPTLDAFNLMREHKISCLPVVDDERRLVGIVTDHDFMVIAGRLLERILQED